MKPRAELRSLLTSEPQSRMPWKRLGQRSALSHLEAHLQCRVENHAVQGKGESNERALSQKPGSKWDSPTQNDKGRQGTGNDLTNRCKGASWDGNS